LEDDHVSTQPPPPPLFTQRALTIMTLAIIAGLVFGAVTFAAYANPWAAVAAGLTAIGVTMAALHNLVE
jgi:hypothetical protein